MAETLLDEGTGPKWHWHSIMADLEAQGVHGVVIDPLSVTDNGCNGYRRDCGGDRYNCFTITWVRDKFFMLSMAVHDEEMVQAFARILEYLPFCQYQLSSRVVSVEWSKIDADERFAELQKLQRQNLQRLPIAA